MTNSNSDTAVKTAPRFSLDTWAVLIALLAAALIRFGLIARVPW
jgi:hypothetical protein